jgi:hypothetical protein
VNKDLEDTLTDIPTVNLPMGVTLKHALACVEFVKRLTEGQASSGN